MKRRYFDIKADKTKPHSDAPTVAIISLAAGENAKELPTLALNEDEWKKIGIKMGWVTND